MPTGYLKHVSIPKVGGHRRKYSCTSGRYRNKHSTTRDWDEEDKVLCAYLEFESLLSDHEPLQARPPPLPSVYAWIERHVPSESMQDHSSEAVSVEADFSLCEDQGSVASISGWDLVSATSRQLYALNDEESWGDGDGFSVLSLKSNLPCAPVAAALSDSTEPRQGPKLKSAPCAICLEEKRTFTLMFNCSGHPSACRECLNKHYVKYQMADASNFPLTCFWPGCSRRLSDLQMQLITRRDTKTMGLFYLQQRQARELRRETKRRQDGKARQEVVKVRAA